VRLKGGKEGEGARAGATRAEVARKREGQRKGKGREEEEGAPTGGVPVSATVEKEKKKAGRGPLRVRGKWAGGLLGQKGKEVYLFFFYYFFQTLFKLTF
jgi:hypothetical protein